MNLVEAPPQVVFLDAAGTLFELQEPVGVTYARFAAVHGLEVNVAVLETAFRTAWKELPPPVPPEGCPPTDDDRGWWMLLVRRSFAYATGRTMDEEWFPALFDALYAHFALPQAWRLFPDVVPALKILRDHVRMFVLSNFDRRLPAILSGLCIADYFEAVVVSSEVGASKPHPRIFNAAIKMAAVPVHECLHVGDEEGADVQGAEAVGIPAIRIDRPRMTLLDVADKVRRGDISRLRSTGK